MIRRTFGWIQNPNLLVQLRDTVEVLAFDSEKNHYIRTYKLPLLLKNNLITKDDYTLFMEELSKTNIIVKYSFLKGRGGPRGFNSSGSPKSLCSGIIQSVIVGQKKMNLVDLDDSEIERHKPYVDDWTAEGYLRWAISTGLLDYNNDDDTVTISQLGKALVNTIRESEEENKILAKALLSYPPVIRVLEILSDGSFHTKFEIGSQFGFTGELGFTSVPQNFFFAEVCTASTTVEASKIRQNDEGDADKYARTICNWLIQMDWVQPKRIDKTETYSGDTYTMKMLSYKITPKGMNALKLSRGYSSNPQIPKIVHFEMLASNKTPDADYLRGKRARILEYLSGQTQFRTYQEIYQYLKSYDIKTTELAIVDDITGLQRIGLSFDVKQDTVKLKDKITHLIIPSVKFEALEISEKKDIVRDKLKHVDHKYLSLIDLAFSNTSNKRAKNQDAREFEIETESLFVDELKFQGMRLGDSGKPDVIIYYDTNGAIIDNKSYKDGFNVDKHCSDEMTRYILQNKNRIPGEPPNEWWKEFDDNVTSFKYLFITSFLKGNFENNLKSISVNTGVDGAAIGVENLLYFAENIKSNKITKADFFDCMNNQEMIA